MTHRLNLDDLEVSTFEPSPEPTSPLVEPMGPRRVDWTGCMSDCSGCGFYCQEVLFPY